MPRGSGMATGSFSNTLSTNDESSRRPTLLVGLLDAMFLPRSLDLREIDDLHQEILVQLNRQRLQQHRGIFDKQDTVRYASS